MKFSADQKLSILIKVPAGERHALETIWGIGSEFYAYLFQCFKASQKEGLGTQYDQLKVAFPDEEQAYREYLTGNLKTKLKEILEDKK